MQLPSPILQRLTNITRLSAALQELQVAIAETQCDLDLNPLSVIVAGHYGGTRLVVESDGTVQVQGGVSNSPLVVSAPTPVAIPATVTAPIRATVTAPTPDPPVVEPPLSEYPPGYIEEIVEDVDDSVEVVENRMVFEEPEDLSFLLNLDELRPPSPPPPPRQSLLREVASVPAKTLQGKSLSQIALLAEQDTDIDKYVKT